MAGLSNIIDMRSDTVTKPTPEMREAMKNALVGDDVIGDDPTVIQLQQRAASILGKESALFVPSGTMANLIAILTHCWTRGSEYIVGDKAHIYEYEQGGASQLGGCHPRVLLNRKDGTISLEDIENNIRGDDDHFPNTKLICLENTHGKCGGRVLTPAYIDSVGELAKRYNLKLHIDGARIMNAAVVLNETPARIVQKADSVSLCLSKGLGAPVGSILASTSEFIVRAKRLRKVLGGGMRQAGILAAAGLIALEQMSKLHIDHANAKKLANGLLPLAPHGLHIDMETVETNFVFVDITRPDMDAASFTRKLSEKGVLVSTTGKRQCRFSLHHQISTADVEQVISSVTNLVSEPPAA